MAFSFHVGEGIFFFIKVITSLHFYLYSWPLKNIVDKAIDFSPLTLGFFSYHFPPLTSRYLDMQ